MLKLAQLDTEVFFDLKQAAKNFNKILNEQIGEEHIEMFHKVLHKIAFEGL